MKRFFLFVLLSVASSCYAKQTIMHSLYLADRPDFRGDNEFSMVGEFGYLLASGNTNASSITAKINASQELSTWSYQIIGDTLYKQNETLVNGRKTDTASAQKVFVSGQFDHKLVKPDERLFIYGEYEDNRFNGFRYQAALAAGWSSRIKHDKQSEFRYSIGPGYSISEVENESTTNNLKGFIVRAAMEYKSQFSDYATFRQFLSTEADQEFNKTKSETSLTTNLSGALAMKLSFVMNLDTSVADEIEDLSTEAAVTVVYQFF